ncbi:hypothetical protein [Streptomyces sp. NBC_00690]|uniref:hypothetical protein n=1 Tax=Streptomyces sp. NBC_00690 TaxID=2975808 RepID=UPI002E2D6B13|nr:hypothetical protein [Streptomyces sp. NBC_00690]
MTATTLTAIQVAQAVEVLAHPGVIRLVTEIDDHGPIARHLLSRTFTDLPLPRVRAGSALAREHGLVRAGQQAGRPAYRLTEHGSDLADVYDRLARWARASAYPALHVDFTTRVRATLPLLAQEPLPADAQAPAQALRQWIQANRTFAAAHDAASPTASRSASG